MRLMISVGEKCQEIVDKYTSNFHCKKIQIDEAYTFVKKKEKKLTKDEKIKKEFGDQYAFVAIDPDTRFIPLFTVRKRDHKTTNQFIKTLHKKLINNGHIQLTSDGFKPYIPAVEDAFGADIDYAQLIKVFGSEYAEPGRYSPPELLEAIFQVISGTLIRKSFNILCGKAKSYNEDANEKAYKTDKCFFKETR